MIFFFFVRWILILRWCRLTLRVMAPMKKKYLPKDFEDQKEYYRMRHKLSDGRCIRYWKRNNKVQKCLDKNGISNCLCVHEGGYMTFDESPHYECVCAKIPLTDDTFYKQSRPFGKVLDCLIQEKPQDNEFLEYRREFKKRKPETDLQLYGNLCQKAFDLQHIKEKFAAKQEKRRIREAKQEKAQEKK